MIPLNKFIIRPEIEVASVGVRVKNPITDLYETHLFAGKMSVTEAKIESNELQLQVKKDVLIVEDLKLFGVIPTVEFSPGVFLCIIDHMEKLHEKR